MAISPVDADMLESSCLLVALCKTYHIEVTPPRKQEEFSLARHELGECRRWRMGQCRFSRRVFAAGGMSSIAVIKDVMGVRAWGLVSRRRLLSRL